MAFTGVPDVDIKILLDVPDEDLPSVCKTDQYTRELCDSEEHWRERLTYRLGRSINEVPNVSAKEYYLLLSKYNNSEIEAALRLSPEENYLRLRAIRGDAIPGAEKYIDLQWLFPQAFKQGNRETIEYLMDVYGKLLTLRRGPRDRPTFPGLSYTVAAAIDYGDNRYIDELRVLDSLNPYTPNSAFSSNIAIVAMGRNLRQDLFDIYNWDVRPCLSWYLTGILEGSYNPVRGSTVDDYYDAFIKAVDGHEHDRFIINRIDMPCESINRKLDPRLALWLASHGHDISCSLITILRNIKDVDTLLSYKYLLKPQEFYGTLARIDPLKAIGYYNSTRKGKIDLEIIDPTTSLLLLRFIAEETGHKISNLVDIDKISRPDFEVLMEEGLVDPTFIIHRLISAGRDDLFDLIPLYYLTIDEAIKRRDIVAYLLLIHRGDISMTLEVMKQDLLWRHFTSMVKSRQDLETVSIDEALEIV